MMPELNETGWPFERLGEAMDALATRAGIRTKGKESRLSQGADSILPPQDVLDDDARFSRWLTAAALWLGIDAERTHVPYVGLDRLLAAGTPAILRVDTEAGPRFLAVAGVRRGDILLLRKDGSLQRASRATVRHALAADLERPLVPGIDKVLDEASLSGRRRGRARRAMLREQLGHTWLENIWLLAPAPNAEILVQASHARLPFRLLGFVAAHALLYALWILSWWMLGKSVLMARFDYGWLLAWALVLLTMVPLHLVASWSAGAFAIGAGGLLRLRLLYGALKLEPEEVKHQGAGQFLGRVFESESLETLALSGGLLGILAVIEIALAAGVLAAGAGGLPASVLLLGWGALALGFGGQLYRRRNRWTDTRIEMTHDLVEKMVGHKTRLAQGKPEDLHAGEDAMLERYLGLSRDMDRTEARLMALIPRGWLIVGIAGLAPGFVSGQASPTGLAIGLGGVLLAYEAFRKLSDALPHVTGAAVAWSRIASLFQAASRMETPGNPAYVEPSHADEEGRGEPQPVVDARDLRFRYRKEREPVLKECSLRIRRGDRVLLEGPSGGGKSTLASLLSGLRLPEAGLLLLGGLDRNTLGSEGWRRRVVAAPQFHENHVLTGSFAFNLLMGFRWPAWPEDYERAESLCRELGLGELLDRMPGGMLQLVGETGWQLSHGEKSRLYIARALLQGARLIVLDESFAALDPANLKRALECVWKRSRSLVVIAHP